MLNDLKIYLGVDWGKSRIGLAMADSETRIATAYGTVATADELIVVAEKEQADTIVIGAPHSLVDKDYPLSAEFSAFVDDLREKLPIAIELFDERLSSKAADALSGGKKDKASRDELSAMIILQDYLDRYGRDIPA